MADSYDVYYIFEQTLADLNRRMGSTEPTSAADPEKLARMWEERRSLYEHLAHTAENFWLAERDGLTIGFSRSILRDGVRQLTEFFVLPDQQSAGIGRELLARTFPAEGARQRSILSSPDIRAQARYLKSGMYPQFTVYYFYRKPAVARVTTDLTLEPIGETPEQIASLGELDEKVLGFRRDVDHVWLSRDRRGYLYYRNGRPVGYGYVGVRNGPFALLDQRDFPAVLAHAEAEARASGRGHFGLEVPMISHTVVDYLLARGYRMDPFIIHFLVDKPFGNFENYIFSSPPFFL